MENRLSHIDLNLLIALQALLEERNVTRAAKRLFITQPAMSKTLQRLRALFDDPLFTRTAHGLIPTPKAVQLQTPLNSVLHMMESTIFTSDFDPSEAEGLIHISLPEMVAIGAIPRLLKRIQERAPKVKLQTRNILDDHMDLLASGALDFSIYIKQGPQDDFEFHPIGSHSAVCWVRDEHPLAKKDVLEPHDITSFPHVTLYLPFITEQDDLKIEQTFHDAGIQRQVILETTQLLTALEVLSMSDALMLGPKYLGEFQLTKGHMVSIPFHIPELNKISFSLCLIQHRRTLNSPLHKWIREQLIWLFETAASRL